MRSSRPVLKFERLADAGNSKSETRERSGNGNIAPLSHSRPSPNILRAEKKKREREIYFRRGRKPSFAYFVQY